VARGGLRLFAVRGGRTKRGASFDSGQALAAFEATPAGPWLRVSQFTIGPSCLAERPVR